MKRLIDRVYAPQRMVSFDGVTRRQRAEADAGGGWMVFYFLIVGALALASRLG